MQTLLRIWLIFALRACGLFLKAHALPSLWKRLNLNSIRINCLKKKKKERKKKFHGSVHPNINNIQLLILYTNKQTFQGDILY